MAWEARGAAAGTGGVAADSAGTAGVAGEPADAGAVAEAEGWAEEGAGEAE